MNQFVPPMYFIISISRDRARTVSLIVFDTITTDTITRNTIIIIAAICKNFDILASFSTVSL